MSAELVPVGPGVKDPATANVLKSHEIAIRALQRPGEPSGLLMTTVAKLPDPTNYPPSVVIASDIPALAFCDGVNWRRADTNAIIA